MGRALPNVTWIVQSCPYDPVVFILTPAACPQQGLLPVQHFWGCAAPLGLNWCHRFLKIPQVMCISDINLSCPKGDREANQLNGKGIKKFPYQNFSRHALLKHKDDIKSELWCRALVYFPSCSWYFKCSLWHSYVIRLILKSSPSWKVCFGGRKEAK